MQKLSDDKLKTTVLETVSHEIEMLKNGQSIEQMFKYLSIFYKEPASLIDYLPEDGVVILDEISVFKKQHRILKQKRRNGIYHFLVKEQLFKIYLSLTHSRGFFIIKRSFVYLTLFLRHIAHTHPQNIVNVTCKTMQDFHGQMNLLKQKLIDGMKGILRLLYLEQMMNV